MNSETVSELVGAGSTLPGYPRMVYLPLSEPGKPVNLALNPTPVPVSEYLKLPVPYGDLQTLDEIAVWNSRQHTLDPEPRWFDFSSDLARTALEAMQGTGGWINFIPETASGYAEYAPLYHLIEPAELERVGLPVLGSGVWPVSVRDELTVDGRIPASFSKRLGQAWARTVWNRIYKQDGISVFSADDPIQMLAHNLDFWLPAAHEVMASRLVPFGVARLNETACMFEPANSHCVAAPATGYCMSASLRFLNPIEEELARRARSFPLPVAALWSGSAEAKQVIDDIVEVADRAGRLRKLVKNIKKNRVEGDFGPMWSRSKADFEKRLRGRKLNGVRVTFVELDKGDVVVSATSSVHGNIARNEFMTWLDPKNQQIFVLLEAGVTNLGEIAELLGFADHSPVSRRRDHIRRTAADYFDRP